ncbi:MAG: histidine phosphatase family protein [Planctomycetota bacterium]|jgi:broad specificity phosphatase PhoE
MRFKGISFSTIIHIIVFTCLLGALGCEAGDASAGPATRLILVRHAEKAVGEGDVPLTKRGEERAERLAALLAQAGVTAIYSTEWLRNQMTAKPISDRTGIPVTTFPVGPDAAEHARAMAAKLRSGVHADETVLCVEHSNTIAPILAELGAEGFEGKAEYPHIFIVDFGEGMKTELMILRFEF